MISSITDLGVVVASVDFTQFTTFFFFSFFLFLYS